MKHRNSLSYIHLTIPRPRNGESFMHQDIHFKCTFCVSFDLLIVMQDHLRITCKCVILAQDCGLSLASVKSQDLPIDGVFVDLGSRNGQCALSL